MLPLMSSELFIPWEGTDERGVQAQLQELDDRLFLDKESNGRELFYTVKYFQGGTLPPELVLDWRETDGTPKRLSSGVAYEIQKMMKHGSVSVKDIIASNNRLRDKRADEMGEAYQEAALDVARLSRVSAVLPRSRSLYLARARERARRPK